MSAAKWILGALGFAAGGPIGALIGVAIGALWDFSPKILASSDNYQWNPSGSFGRAQNRQQATQGDMRVSLIVLVACVMKADGRVLKSEVNYVKPFFVANFGEEGAHQALQLLRQLLEQDIDTTAVSQQIAQYVNYSSRLEIIHMLLGLANADGDFDSREEELIHRIATEMGVNEPDYKSLLSLYRKSRDANWAYDALEIQPDATDDEVKRAYRRMAMKYHPDKVAGSGEEMQRNATEKFRAINEAYEHLKSIRGMK